MQLNRMNNDHQQVVKAFHAERAKVERLTTVVKLMYDVMCHNFPNQLPVSFPQELLEPSENPPIFITSPSDTPFGGSNGFTTSFPSHIPSPAYFNNMAVSPISPSSSPTSPEFPSTYSLSANSSSLHLNLDHQGLTPNGVRYDSSLPPSPEAGRSTPDLLGESGGRSGVGAKRQRMNDISSSSASSSTLNLDDASSPLQVPRLVRARSDSAPLGMHIGSSWENGMRPRSGTGLSRGRRDDGGGYFGRPAGLGPAGIVTVKNEHDPSQ